MCTIASGIPNNGQATVTIPTVQQQVTPVAEIMLQIVASGTASEGGDRTGSKTKDQDS